MCRRPSLAENTCRGSSALVSFSHVVRPVRSLPLKRGSTAAGRTGSDFWSAAQTAVRPKVTATPAASVRGTSMVGRPGPLLQVDVDRVLHRLAGVGQPRLVGRVVL